MLFAPVFYAFAGVAYFDAIGTLTEEKEQIAAAEQRGGGLTQHHSTI